MGPPYEPGGQTAWVAPAQAENGALLVLKVAWRHPEAEYEAEGLRHWDGRGTVRIVEEFPYDDQTVALVLERCNPGTMLKTIPESTQDTVISGLLTQLWAVPLPSPSLGFPTLAGMCRYWADGFEDRTGPGRPALDPGVVREGVALLRSLPGTASRAAVLATDLHAENVLAAERQPWLVIDPKPHVGDPTFDVLQHMLNCKERLRSDPKGLASRMAGLLDLDRLRLELWLFARCVQESIEWPGLAEVARELVPA